MTDFAPARSAQKTYLAYAEGGEIVMQHKPLESFALEHIEPLHVFRRSERRCYQRLRFTAREQRRAVRARQQADLASDRPDLIECAPVGTLALQQDIVAEDALFKPVEGLSHLVALFLLGLGIAGKQLLAQFRNPLLAFELWIFRRVHGLAQAGLNFRANLVLDGLVKFRRDKHALPDPQL